MNRSENKQSLISFLILAFIFILMITVSYLFFYTASKKAIRTMTDSKKIIHYADSLGFTPDEMKLIVSKLSAGNLQKSLMICYSDTFTNQESRYSVFINQLMLPESAKAALLNKIPSELAQQLMDNICRYQKFLSDFFPDLKRDLLKELKIYQ